MQTYDSSWHRFLDVLTIVATACHRVLRVLAVAWKVAAASAAIVLFVLIVALNTSPSFVKNASPARMTYPQASDNAFPNPNEPSLTTASGRTVDYVALGGELTGVWFFTGICVFILYFPVREFYFTVREVIRRSPPGMS
jgi:hypothetical protein